MDVRNLHITEEEYNKLINLGKSATITNKGIVQLATIEEVIDGIDNEKIITPALLKQLLDYLGFKYTGSGGTDPGDPEYSDNINDIENITNINGIKLPVTLIGTMPVHLVKSGDTTTINLEVSNEARPGVQQFATLQEIIDGTAGSKFISPLILAQYITYWQDVTMPLPTMTVNGMEGITSINEVPLPVEFESNSPVYTGLFGDVLELGIHTATTSSTGIEQFATLQELIDGTGNGKLVSPAVAKEYIEYLKLNM